MPDPSVQRVLVREPIAESGIELLRDEVDVEQFGFEMSDEELAQRIGEFDALLIRSGTQVTADLIERADRLKVIGRAGTGVDNVDVEAATKRGIVVANAPESNSVAAANDASNRHAAPGVRRRFMPSPSFLDVARYAPRSSSSIAPPRMNRVGRAM